ncbi:universal stress protein [Saliphagus sp. LR7]|uniref:universal stress protein n=1 Tax=Saliphagus sp. LR7 TaxID=2282654 RepID=UPI0018E5A3C3|nr:universal stress protein [Saliphagus sp. LR7]
MRKVGVDMYHVLVPIDTNEDRALSQARAAAALHREGSDIQATLLHVFDDRDRAETTSVTQLEVGNRVAEYLSDQGVSVHTESRYGDPASEIVEAADELNADNIILGGRKRSKLGSLIFGSVSQTVTLEANHPVTITGDTVKADPTYICETCGKKYYTESEITTCNSCGGVKIKKVG